MSDTSAPERGQPLSGALILLMAIACGAMVANLYYAQTLIDAIGREIGLSQRMAGAIVTLTQLGYGVGLALIVPLGDLFENRRLILMATAGAVIGSIGVALSGGPVSFLAASLVMGICATGAQILVPFASLLSPPERQGRTIGLVMSGLLTGIMLARPIASFVAGQFGWRAIFCGSAAAMTAIGIALALMLPKRTPAARLGYIGILASILSLMREHRQLRLRSFYQAAMFVAFNLFWTVAPLVLLHRFGFTNNQVALFALAGAGGAAAAPIAGKLADHGKVRLTTLVAMALLTLSFVAADFIVAAGSVLAFALTAVLIDAAVQLNQISGQKIVFALSSDARARVNAGYMTVIFVIGASGSLIGTTSYAAGGWPLTALIGAGIGALVLFVALVFDR